MREETVKDMPRIERFFLDDDVYDMGGGYNPITPQMVGGRKVYVVDYLPHTNVDVVDDLQSLSKIEDNSIPNIFCADVIEHIENPWLAISHFHRVLKPQGVLFLTAPFIWHLHGHELEKDNWKSRIDFWRFTPAALGLLCHKYFEDIECDWDRDPPLGPQNTPLWRVGAHYIGKNLKEPRQQESVPQTPQSESW